MSYMGRNLFEARVYTNCTIMSKPCFRGAHKRCNHREPLYQDVHCQCECHQIKRSEKGEA